MCQTGNVFTFKPTSHNKLDGMTLDIYPSTIPTPRIKICVQLDNQQAFFHVNIEVIQTLLAQLLSISLTEKDSQ